MQTKDNNKTGEPQGAENTQHTPGPWHVERHNGRFEIWPKDTGHTHGYVGIVQKRADADLVAITPELLSFARNVVEALLISDEGRGPLARALIAKGQLVLGRLEAQ